jgi:methionyl-tRNA formyltransferase
LVVTQPDRPSGRGHKLQPTPVKSAALELGIEIWQPASLREAAATLAPRGADIFAVASYGKILPQALLDVPPLGAINVHPSLLPLYRGATPLFSQIRDGVSNSGITIIAMDAGMDTGDIVLQEPATIGPADTHGIILERFARVGAELVTKACELAASGRLERRPQAGLASPQDIARTTTRPLSKEDLLIDWKLPAQPIADHVRALSPRPAARAHLETETQTVKVLQARAAAGVEPGELTVPCGDGEYVVIERLVPPNRKPMTGRDYVIALRSNAASAAARAAR